MTDSSDAQDLNALPYADQHWLRPRLRDLKRRQRNKAPSDRLQERIDQRLAKARRILAAREAAALKLEYPAQLPVSAHAEKVKALLKDHQVIVLAGHTGSGKTTQLPKMCLQAGLGIKGQIAHTQPRRLAAVSVAERLAEECGQEAGQAIAYQVRFDKAASANSRVKVMTDGVLLNEIHHDPLLLRYDCIILDEAHERSLNIDFLLGYLKRILVRRPELRVLVTSATIDTERFSQFFDEAPIIEVSGTLFPVESRYREAQDYGLDDNASQAEHIAQAVAELFEGPRPEGPSDVLVFLATEEQIHAACRYLRGFCDDKLRQSVDILPLYARQSMKEQKRVFQRPNDKRRRIIISTNIAETSLTVPGIRYVIDAGDARISRYSYRSKIQQLPIEEIAQASADQRKGRCGRLAEGVCIRLYSEENFQARAEFAEPEILRTNLASVVLRLYALNIADIEAFDFVDAPDPRLLRDGLRLLEEVEAVEAPGKLSAIGWKLTRLPLDPRLGRILLAGESFDCLREMQVLAAALSVQDPRERPRAQQEQADKAHADFVDPRSDFMALLKLWQHLEKSFKAQNERRWRAQFKREFINPQRAMDWRDVYHQLGRLCEEIGLKPQLEKKETEKKERASYSSIHRALLTGLLTHIGLFDERKRYKGVRQRQFRIFPGSGLAAKTPAWIVAAELVETRELYARTVASVQQAWVLKAAAHLLQRSHSDPFFDAKRGEVMAYERSTLYGLVLNERHAVPYGRINPQHARQIFIDEVLIHGRSQSMPGLLKKNQRAQKEARDIANRLRRPDALIDEEVLAEHYDKLLPTAMSAVPQLRRFLAGLDKTASDALLLDAYSMLRDVSLDGMRQDFPDTINYGGNEFAVSYAFDPASEKDGIHVSVPAPLRTLIPDTAFDNLVPGYFEEKCIALMKTLPKQLRKQLLPYPASFASLRPALERQEGGLLQRLETAIEKQFSLRIKREDWQPEKLPAWLTATVNVQEDEAAKAQETATLAATDHYFFLDTFDGRQVTADNYPDLPEQYRYKRSGLEYSAFPGLCQLESGIHLCLYHDQAYGRLHSAMAAAELARQNLSALLNGLRRRLVQGNAQKLHLSTIPEREQFLADFVMRIGVEACGIFEQAPIDAASLMAALKRGKAELGQQEQEWKLFLERLLLQHYNLAMALKDVNKSQYSRLFDDVANLREALLCKGFMMRTPKQWLWHYPRYLQAAAYRVERHRQQGGRDAQLQDKLDVWQQRLQAMPLGKAEQRLFWMLQEYRVSLFAQQLKTSIPVSETRLRQLWEGAQD